MFNNLNEGQETGRDNGNTGENNTETVEQSQTVENGDRQVQSMDYTDVTTIGDIKTISEKIQQVSLFDQHKMLVEAIDEKINFDVDTLIEGQVPVEVFNEMVSLGQNFRILLSRLENYAVGFHTSLQIKQGAYYDKLKKVAQKADIPWDKWFKKNIKGISRRSIQDFIRLSKFAYMDKWAFMGKERLISIVGVCEKAKKAEDWKENLIKFFIEENNIETGNEPADNFAVFRLDIDTAVNIMRLANEGLNELTSESVKIFTEKHGLLTRLHIKDLDKIDDEGGDVQERFNKFVDDESGKPPVVKASDGDKFRDKIEGFTNILKKAIKDPKSLESLNEDTVRKLTIKVKKLERIIANN